MSKFIKILKINQLNLVEAELNIDTLTEENYVAMDTYTFLIKALETYKNRVYEENEIITDIIECNLPDTEEEAKALWTNGITAVDGTYLGWFASTGMMKKEDKYGGKCDTFFIKEDMKEFTKWLEKEISLGKFVELENKEININKDMLSRLSLVTSTLVTETELDINNVVILKGQTLSIAGNQYKTVVPYPKPEINKKGEVIERIAYKLQNWTAPETKTIDIFDGGGLMGLNVARRIGTSLNRNDIEFAVIRAYGLGIKGLVTKFNIEKYMNVFYKNDNETFKKVDDKFYALDMFGDWREINNNTLLLNESMVKLAKWSKNMDEIKSLMTTQAEQFKNEEGKVNIFDKLYICKVNKIGEKLEQYTRLNYQLLNALNITIDELKELAQEDITLYKKLIKPYDKTEDDFEVNADMINLFYNRCASDKTDFNEIINNVLDKTNLLINIDNELVATGFVRNQLCKLVEKKVRELALGKITCKALYQYCAIDPLYYMNEMMGIRGTITLEKGQVYSANCNNKSIKTIQRNPLMAYSEVLNVEFTRSTFLDNWLSPCKELIYFNQKSDIAVTMSTMDFDGDGILVIDNEIVRNSVVTPKDRLRFYNKEDGKKAPLILNPENRFIATYRASGNLIGKLAIKGSTINTLNCQYTKKYYVTGENEWYTRNELGLKYKDLEGTDLNAKIKAKVELGELQYSNSIDKSILKDKLSCQFNENETDVYTALLLSQIAIDAPKTLVFPSKQEQYALEKYSRKPWFLQFDKDYYNIKNLGDKYFALQYMYPKNSTMDIFARHINDTLIESVNKILYIERFYDKVSLLQNNLKNDKYNCKTLEECRAILVKLYDLFNAKQSKIDNNFRLEKDKNINNTKLLNDVVKKYKIDKKVSLNNAIELINQNIYPKYDMATICQSIATMKNCSERFILNVFIDTLQFMDTNVNNPKSIFKECEEGNLIFRGKKYLKITENCDISESIKNIKVEDMIQNGTARLVRFGVVDESIKEDLTIGLILKLDDERISKFEKSEKDKKQYEGLKKEITILKIEKISRKSFGIVIGL